jgi:hypothetical protein
LVNKSILFCANLFTCLSACIPHVHIVSLFLMCLSASWSPFFLFFLPHAGILENFRRYAPDLVTWRRRRPDSKPDAHEYKTRIQLDWISIKTKAPWEAVNLCLLISEKSA